VEGGEGGKSGLKAHFDSRDILGSELATKRKNRGPSPIKRGRGGSPSSVWKGREKHQGAKGEKGGELNLKTTYDPCPRRGSSVLLKRRRRERGDFSTIPGRGRR